MHITETLILNVVGLAVVKTLQLLQILHGTHSGWVKKEIGLVLLEPMKPVVNLVEFVDIGLKFCGKIQLILVVLKFVVLEDLLLLLILIGPFLFVIMPALEITEDSLLSILALPVLSLQHLSPCQ